MPLNLLMEFRLSPPGGGIACDTSGAFLGSVALLKRTDVKGTTVWEPRDSEELSAELGSHFGLPIDVSPKAAGLAAVARDLNAGDVAHAQLVALHLQFPEPPPLANGKPSREELIKFIRELYASGLIKADWKSDDHPRWPGGTAGSQGGQFAPKGGGSASTTRTLQANSNRS